MPDTTKSRLSVVASAARIFVVETQLGGMIGAALFLRKTLPDSEAKYHFSLCYACATSGSLTTVHPVLFVS